MKRINILFLITSLSIGGTETHIYNLVSSLNMERFNPVVCCLYNLGLIGAKLLNNEKSIKVYHNIMKNKWDIFGAWKLIHILKDENIHILYIVNSPLTMFWGIICAKFAKVNACLTRITVSKPISHTKRRWIANNIMLSFIDVIIAQAHSHKDYLISHDGFKPDKIEVVYNGVNLERFMSPPKSGNLKQIIGIPEEVPVIGIVGRLSPEKGLIVFLDAARKILNDFPYVHFIIAGDGPERKKLEDISCKLEIQPNVHFLGARTDIPQILSLFDVGIMASNIENFSNAILEYMAAAKPVVATNVGGTAEQVIDGETGFLISNGDSNALADAILALLKDKSLAKKMGEKGREKIKEKFTIQEMVSRYEDLFIRLLNR